MSLSAGRGRGSRVALLTAAWFVVGITGWTGLVVIAAQLAGLTPPRAGGDLRLLIDAATRWQAGASLYSAGAAQNSLVAESLFSSYPPLVAQALVPLTALPFWVVLGGWAVGAGAGLGAVAHRIGQAGRDVTLPAVALVAFVYPFAIAVLLATSTRGSRSCSASSCSPSFRRVASRSSRVALPFPSRRPRNSTRRRLVCGCSADVGAQGPGTRVGGSWPSLSRVASGSCLRACSSAAPTHGPSTWPSCVVARAQADIVSPQNIGPSSQIALAFGLSEVAARLIQVPVTVAALAVTVAAGRLVDDPIARFGAATVASLVALPVTWFHYPVALLPVAIAAATRAGQVARSATTLALICAIVSAGLAIVAPVCVWIAVAFVLIAVRLSRPRA